MGDVILLDVGNTETHFGLWRGDALVGRRTLTTRRYLTADEAEAQARGVLGLLSGSEAPAGAILSCVVPTLTAVWREALERISQTRPLVVGPGLKTGLRMHFNDPSEVGPDRIADAVAARETYGAPVVAVDLGTTTNIEVVDREGVFVGGIIAPGLRLGARALSQGAARLPMIELRAPTSVIGRNTRTAMQSGIVLGEVARTDGLLDAVMRELGTKAPVIVTGDDAATIATLLAHDVTVDETLTLRGLALLWQRNHRA